VQQIPAKAGITNLAALIYHPLMTELNDTPNPEFQRIRDELDIPRYFPADVLAETATIAARDPRAPQYAAQFADLLAVPFATIDPPGSRDLDQAFFIAKRDDGYLVRYAIADVGFFVAPGSAIEDEAWRRGQTLYSPDVKTRLYPPALSEDGASLLPDVVRPAIVFTFALNEQAEAVSLAIARALVSSRVQLAYPEVSEHLARERQRSGSGALSGQEWSQSLRLLEEVGRRRQRLEAARGAVNLRIPAQEVQRWRPAAISYRLAFETASEVEEWNAQISLLTGIGAAHTMLAHGVGLLRTLAPPRRDRVRALRLTAEALGVSWPARMDYDDFVRCLDPRQPMHAVMLHQAARVTGGARYVYFAGESPRWARHSAIAAPYAHVTAPLRRLADRYVLELLIALSAKTEPAPELLAALAELPQVMAAADNVAHRLESAIVDYVEARLMQDRIGEAFNAIIIALRVDGVVVQIAEPPIRALLPLSIFTSAGQAGDDIPITLSEDGATLSYGAVSVTLGQSLSLRLVAADTTIRSLGFSLARQA
jgi:exoribonuclease R